MTELTEKQIYKIARSAADESVSHVFEILGVDITDLDNIKRMQATLLWAEESRQLSKKVGGRVLVTVVSILTGAALLASWETIRYKIGLR